jgi:hypothetical protein
VGTLVAILRNGRLLFWSSITYSCCYAVLNAGESLFGGRRSIPDPSARGALIAKPTIWTSSHELFHRPVDRKDLHRSSRDYCVRRGPLGCRRSDHAGALAHRLQNFCVKVQNFLHAVLEMQSPHFAGAGAFVTGTLPVTPGETLRIVVGSAGTTASYGYSSHMRFPFRGSSGGGRSAIQRLIGGVWTDVVSAGGGGAGCYSFCPPVVSSTVQYRRVSIKLHSPPAQSFFCLRCSCITEVWRRRILERYRPAWHGSCRNN